MSWKPWLNLMEKNDYCDYAGIFGKKGEMWVETDEEKKPDWVFPESKCVELVNILYSGDRSVFKNGITINGKNFVCTSIDEESRIIILAGKEPFKNDSLVVASSATALFVGFNGSEVKTSQVRDVVEKTRDTYIEVAETFAHYYNKEADN